MDTVIRELLLPVLLAAVPMFAAVEVKKGENQVDVMIDGQPYTTLYYGENTMKPFLHPLRSASGKIVTRRGPMEQVEGETKDHPHHQGLWFTHNEVNGVNFWEAVKPGPHVGRVVVDKITTAKGGKNSGEIGFEARWVGPGDKAILRETRRMTFHADPKNRIIDVDITLAAIDQPVKFGDTKEGTFAIRLSDKLREKGGSGKLTNAEGGTSMKAVWGKASPWVDYAGTVDDETLGVTIMDHPQNPRYPTYWHARDYGLFSANPFGLHDYYNDKSKDGSMTIDPGKPVRFRYRVVIHPGDTATAHVADLYKAWTH